MTTESQKVIQIDQVREAMSRVVTLIVSASEQKGVTDITLASTGELSIRLNTFLQCSQLDWLKLDWDASMAGLLGTPPWRENPPRLKALIKVVKLGDVRFRCTWSKNTAGESVSIRPLPSEVMSPEELRLPEILSDTVAALNGGLVLICGPTGSGKSWTMASLIKHRANERGGKFIILENPIEFEHKNSSKAQFFQRQVGTDVESYAVGLEEALVENPDCIGVQELRDRESAETALAAALTGHTVFATVHAHDAASAAERYASIMKPASGETASVMHTLALCLELIVGIRLLPGQDGLVPVFDIITVRESAGAPHRVPRITQMIEKSNVTGLRNEQQTGSRYGMTTFTQSVQARIAEGVLLV